MDRSPPLPEATVDHVAIAVHGFAELLPLLEGLAGEKASTPEAVPSQGVEICFVGNVELIRPLDDESGVARFLERRGPGLHHIAYRVDDLGEAMTRLVGEGRNFTSAEPMVGAGGHKIAFLHPGSAGGVLVELVDK